MRKNLVDEGHLKYILIGVSYIAWTAERDKVKSAMSSLRIIIQEERDRNSEEGEAIAVWLEQHQGDIKKVLEEVAKHDPEFNSFHGTEKIMSLRRRVEQHASREHSHFTRRAAA